MKDQIKYKILQDYKYEGDDWWTWWIWVDASDKELDDVDHVVYTLHSTFHNPVRNIKDRKSKFKLETEGWGIFTIYAKIVLKDGKEYSMEHELYLAYPDGKMNEE